MKLYRSILWAVFALSIGIVGIALAAPEKYVDYLPVYRAGIKISSPYVATLTTNFQGIAASDCKDSAAITVTGAAANEACLVAPNATAGALDITFTCYVSAANAVKIHLCNETTSAITGMASGAYKVRVIK